ncbi:hypothetical protein [Phytomonospora endophytica]|uniref:Uncharacterized protein n=1 Tax=Phytomonospora endophytica TaxID=714109 RepID=A0A841FRH2_9ACTN|nr:hypothetical protein [Phytomonospora endophytica]MBB6036378.1 hypothetical protein [Phytomonospora endophytica]GIG65699.1 hypothetical protein Pen01_19940 [Phytomonospora endophytica]
MHEAWYRLAMILVVTAGFWEGVMAAVFKLFTDKEPGVATAVNHLDEPWCYVGAAGVVLLTLVVLGFLDRAHKKALARG